jgi:hypothetical protein
MTNITNLQFILDNKPQTLIHDTRDFTPSGINIQPLEENRGSIRPSPPTGIISSTTARKQGSMAPQDVSRRPANQLTIIKMQ